jgi:hypothetical protein
VILEKIAETGVSAILKLGCGGRMFERPHVTKFEEPSIESGREVVALGTEVTRKN